MDDYEHSSRRLALVEPASINSERIRHPRALQHLREGFNRRVLMLDASLHEIHEQADKTGGKPLSPLLVPGLAIHVNSFWWNVCGALDNLAWSMNYEFGLFPDAVEDVGKQRRSISLFGKKYFQALTQGERQLTIDIEPFRNWHLQLATLRDPAAHRIPVHPIPGVMNEITAAEAKRLYDEAEGRFGNKAHTEGMELMHTAYNLGTYQPWIALSHNGKVELRDLVSEVRRDEETFVQLSSIILRRLFA